MGDELFDPGTAGQAARSEAFRRVNAGLRYIRNRYGHLTLSAQQAGAAMQQVTDAWTAAGTGGVTHPGTPSLSAHLKAAHGGAGAGSGGSSPGPGGGSGGGGISYGVPQIPPGVAWGSAGGGGGGGYASGGLVVYGGGPVTGSGFDSSGPLTVAGSVTGYRWWTIPAPDLALSPAHADEDWPAAPLHGAWAPWAPGVNHAACLAHPDGPPPHDPARVPERACGCGYWAYWNIQASQVHRNGALPVFGVIKGFGKTLTGPHGFRCAKARILGVHLPLTIGNRDHLIAELYRRQAIEAAAEPAVLSPPVPRIPPFTGRVISIGTSHVPWPLQNGGRPPGRIPRELPPPPSEDEIAAEKAKAEAWTAVIGDRIEQLYPGVRVFETRDALLRTFPPDTVYGRG